MDNGPGHRYSTSAGLAVTGGSRGAKRLCKTAQACQARWPLGQRGCRHFEVLRWCGRAGVVGGATGEDRRGGLGRSGNWA